MRAAECVCSEGRKIASGEGNHIRKDKVALSAFYSELQEIQRVAYGANNYFNELDERFKLIKKTLLITPGISNEVINYSSGVEDKIRNIKNIFLGDESISKRNENQTPSLYDRLGRMFYYTWRNSSMPSQTYLDNLAIAKGELQRTILLIKEIINTDIPVMEKELNRVNAPWTPGRLIEMK